MLLSCLLKQHQLYSPWIKGGVLTSKSYYIRNIFCKATAVIYIDFSDGSGKSHLKTSEKHFPFKLPLKTLIIHKHKSKYEH